MSRRIDIGCGDKPRKGYIGLDIREEYKPNILCDVNEGLPFKDGEVSAIWVDNSLEHFKNPIYILQECKRVLRNGGELEIIIPNCQWYPLLILGWFTDIHRFWNWWMNRKGNRGLHYTLWSPYTLRFNLIQTGFGILEEKGWYLGKSYCTKAIK